LLQFHLCTITSLGFHCSDFVSDSSPSPLYFFVAQISSPSLGFHRRRSRRRRSHRRRSHRRRSHCHRSRIFLAVSDFIAVLFARFRHSDFVTDFVAVALAFPCRLGFHRHHLCTFSLWYALFSLLLFVILLVPFLIIFCIYLSLVIVSPLYDFVARISSLGFRHSDFVACHGCWLTAVGLLRLSWLVAALGSRLLA
jgi:hypothetical protein